MDLDEMISGPLSPALALVRTIAAERVIRVWLVGGPVRDALLGRPVNDLDFLVEHHLLDLARDVSEALDCSLRTHPNFMTATILLSNGRSIDFTTARKEIYDRPGALPIVRPSRVEDDLQRRDFTINAIALEINGGTILDPLDGRRDLAARLIRVLHPRSFVDDPTRIIRAVRFKVRLDFEVEAATARLLKEALDSNALQTVSVQRLWRELTKCFADDRASEVVAALFTSGVLPNWLGSSVVRENVYRHLEILGPLAVGDDIDVEIVYLALILSNLERPILPPLDLSRRRKSLLMSLVNGTAERASAWRRLETPEERARFCLDHRPEEIVLVAVELGTDGQVDMAYSCQSLRRQTLPFTGAELETPPGPHVAAALRDAKIRAWFDRPSSEELLRFAREAALRYLSEHNEPNR